MAVGESEVKAQANLSVVRILWSNHLLLLWLVLSNLLAVLLFAWDKFRAGGSGRNRISEFNPNSEVEKRVALRKALRQ